MNDVSSVVVGDGTPVWVTGEGPTVVLVHGVLMDHRMWLPQVEALRANYRVCCMDMLGHGDAPNPPGERCLDDFVEQVRQVVDYFSDAGPPVLGGFSMGGLVAQAYAARYSERLRGLVIMNAVYDRTVEQRAVVASRYQDMCDDGVAGAVRSARARWFTSNDDPRDIEAVIGWIQDGDFASKRKAHRVFATSDAEVTGTLRAVSCPALVMTGELDAGSTPDMAQAIAREIPNSSLSVLAGQRHMMSVLDAPSVNARWLEFLPKCFGGTQ